MFTAGPAISITIAAPGDRPFIISAAATGMLPVEQIYIGIATSRMTPICRSVLLPNERKNESGTATCMRAATSRPISRRPPMSCIISKKAYRNTMKRRLPLGASVNWQQASSETFSGTSRLTRKPPQTPVIRAAAGLIRAKPSPIIENVASMESMPVWGVAIRNEATAPLDAFSFLSPTAVGITPQEHRGSGMPSRAAHSTAHLLSLDRKRV